MGHSLLRQRLTDICETETFSQMRRQVASKFCHCPALLREVFGEIRPSRSLCQRRTDPLLGRIDIEFRAARSAFGAHQQIERLTVGDAALVDLPPKLLDQCLGQRRNAAEVVCRSLSLFRRQGLHVEVV